MAMLSMVVYPCAVVVVYRKDCNRKLWTCSMLFRVAADSMHETPICFLSLVETTKEATGNQAVTHRTL